MTKLFRVTLFFVVLFVSMTGRAEKTYPAASRGTSSWLRVTPFPSIARALATESERDDAPVLTERDGEEEEQDDGDDGDGDDGDGEEFDEAVLHAPQPSLEAAALRRDRRALPPGLPRLCQKALGEADGWPSGRERPPRA